MHLFFVHHLLLGGSGSQNGESVSQGQTSCGVGKGVEGKGVQGIVGKSVGVAEGKTSGVGQASGERSRGVSQGRGSEGRGGQGRGSEGSGGVHEGSVGQKLGVLESDVVGGLGSGNVSGVIEVGLGNGLSQSAGLGSLDGGHVLGLGGHDLGGLVDGGSGRGGDAKSDDLEEENISQEVRINLMQWGSIGLNEVEWQCEKETEKKRMLMCRHGNSVVLYERK